jgi:hypothetical protein
VDDSYKLPFRFTGKLDKLTIRPKMTAAEEKLFQQKTQEVKNAAQ